MKACPPFDVDAFLAAYERLDAVLVKAGFPATSPWWRGEIERFFRSAGRRWVIRAGRRAGKSSTLCRIAVCWALAGTWRVPPGDTAVIPFLSLDREEASGRIRTIDEILMALGVAHEPTADEIYLPSRRLKFSVKTCSVRAVGYTSVAVFADEMARWESRDTSANPASEVMGSVRPTMATQEFAFEICSSSVWSTDDYHAELFDQGNDGAQIVSEATTWLANPTISEARTHELEPDDRIWSREYANVPGSTVSQALDPNDVAAAFAPTDAKLGRSCMAIDASSLRGDAFTWLVACETADGVVIPMASGIEGDDLRRYSMTEIVTKISEQARYAGASTVYGDQREEASLRALFGERDLTFHSYAWSEPSKDAAFQVLRRILRERRIHLPNLPKLKSEMLSVKAHLLPSGRTKYATNGLDYLSAVITLCHAIVDGRVSVGESAPVQFAPPICCNANIDNIGIGFESLGSDEDPSPSWLTIGDWLRRNTTLGL